MSDNRFKVGDVVQLKSGGPVMTVVGIDGEKCECTWFVDNSKDMNSTFPAGALAPFKRPNPAGGGGVFVG